MNLCQNCGLSRSWGPMSPGEISEAFADGKDPLTFLKCDACHFIGHRSAIETMEDPSGHPVSSFGPGVSPLSDIFKVIAGPMVTAPAEPSPTVKAVMDMVSLQHQRLPARLDRLVEVLIQSHPRSGSSQSTQEYARWVVQCARYVLTEMEKPPAGEEP